MHYRAIMIAEIINFVNGMIYSLQGTISEKEKDFIVIETNGVSFQIFVSGFLLEKIKLNQNIKILTYLEVKEDALTLYGFENKTELKYFKFLVAISGIGPKSAINILSLIRLEDLERAVLNEKIDILTKVSGIGKKTAQRIILEFKEKINKNFKSQPNQEEDDSLIVDALITMGYTLSQSREAIKKVPLEIKGTDQRLKQTLKIISGR